MRKEMGPRIEAWLFGFPKEEQKLMLDLLSNLKVGLLLGKH